jgi:hypothetical protein
MRDLKPRDVHAAVLARTGRRLVIDNSKSLSWVRKTLGTTLATRYVHLLRDPRAVVQAWARLGRDKALPQWIEENYAIRRFLTERGLGYRVLTYDDLALDTDGTLGDLCTWLGLAYESSQQSYWQFEHHGAGRNGATAAFLTDYVASDESFYRERFRTNFHDTRWREQMDAATQHAISSDVRLGQFLQDFELELRDDGLRTHPARVI